MFSRALISCGFSAHSPETQPFVILGGLGSLSNPAVLTGHPKLLAAQSGYFDHIDRTEWKHKRRSHFAMQPQGGIRPNLCKSAETSLGKPSHSTTQKMDRNSTQYTPMATKTQPLRRFPPQRRRGGIRAEQHATSRQTGHAGTTASISTAATPTRPRRPPRRHATASPRPHRSTLPIATHANARAEPGR